MDVIPRHLEDVLQKLKMSFVDGVPGVILIDSGRPGPALGITACTHGNEPSGLAVFEYLMGTIDIRKRLARGRIYLVLNNIKATENFFAASTNEAIGRARQVDINMNRLPWHTAQGTEDTRYEMQRSRELLPIWKRFEVGLDIHSTTSQTAPMLISRGGNFKQIESLIRGFPIEVLLSNIDQVQLGTPAFALYGGEDSDLPVFAIEAGQHTDPASFDRAVDCTLALLQNLGMLPGTPRSRITEFREYKMEERIMFSDMSFDFVSSFKTFDTMCEGQVLARNTSGVEILSPFDGHLILPTPKRGTAKDIREEMAFLSRPVEIRTVN